MAVSGDDRTIRVSRLDLSKVGREGIPDDVSNMHWGPISRELCERELSDRPFGTFLLRQRLENPKDHVLSTITAKGFFHIIIQETAEGTYKVSARIFPKLSDVVQDYQSRGLKEPLLREMRTGKEAPQQMFKWFELSASPPLSSSSSSSSSSTIPKEAAHYADGNALPEVVTESAVLSSSSPSTSSSFSLRSSSSSSSSRTLPTPSESPYIDYGKLLRAAKATPALHPLSPPSPSASASTALSASASSSSSARAGMRTSDDDHKETTYTSSCAGSLTEGSWNPVPLPSSEEAKLVDIKQLSVVTFNVWFDGFLQRERADALFEICRSCQADVMCFQEVTAPFLGWLLSLPWVREHYYVNDIDGVSWGTWYGVLVLTRFLPTKLGILTDFPTNQGRRFVYVDLLLNCETFRIGTVHLESFARSTNFRMAQLDRIFPILSSPVIDHSALLGDMNLCSTWEENERGFAKRSDDQQHQDVWCELRSDDVGYTENTDINTMRLKSPNQGHEKKVRFDRILLRSTGQKWRAVSIQLLGTSPIAPDVFPSDHFGLHSVFYYSKHWDDSQHAATTPTVLPPSPVDGPQACYLEDF